MDLFRDDRVDQWQDTLLMWELFRDLTRRLRD
jgi:hypothetical protein